jgi:hypothetical protein
LIKSGYRKQPDLLIKLNPFVKDPKYQGNILFYELVEEIFLENLKECKPTKEILELTAMMSIFSSNKVMHQLIDCLVKNKYEFEPKLLFFFESIHKVLTESQFVFLLEKIEKMKESMLKLDQDVLRNFLNFSPPKSKKCNEIILRFLFLYFEYQNVSLFNNVSRRNCPLYSFNFG